MSAALELYTQLTEAPDEKTRARLIADAFDALEARFPQITDLATQGHVRESELRLQKEIKEVQKEIAEVELRLQKEIKQVQKEIAEVELRLQERLARVEVSLHQAMASQTRWLLGGLAALGALLKLADVLIQ